MKLPQLTAVVRSHEGVKRRLVNTVVVTVIIPTQRTLFRLGEIIVSETVYVGFPASTSVSPRRDKDSPYAFCPMISLIGYG